jgi:hypothetical protein
MAMPLTVFFTEAGCRWSIRSAYILGCLSVPISFLQGALELFMLRVNALPKARATTSGIASTRIRVFDALTEWIQMAVPIDLRRFASRAPPGYPSAPGRPINAQIGVTQFEDYKAISPLHAKRLQSPIVFLRLYLKIPLLWRIFGRQFLTFVRE